jgi:hypothetical protein
MINIICPCGRTISTTLSRAKRKKYCSKKCFYRYRPKTGFQKGHLFYKGGEKGWFKKGIIPWIKGKKGIHNSPKTEYIKGNHYSPKTEFNAERVVGEKNSKWKGENVGYYGIHTWIKRHYGKADKCENRDNQVLEFKCNNKSKNYDWAFMGQSSYKRDRKLFIKLCHSCHLKYDKQQKIKHPHNWC